MRRLAGGNLFSMAVAMVLIAFLVHNQFFQSSSVDVSEPMHEMLQRYLPESGRVYVERVEKHLQQSLMRLYDDLDRDGDGCIKRSEFSGKALHIAATLRDGFTMPQLPTPPNITTVTLTLSSSMSLVRRVVGLQLMFLAVLFVWEHIRLVLWDPPFEVISPGSIDDSTTTKDPHGGGGSPRRMQVPEALHYDTPSTPYETFKFYFFLCTGLLCLRIVLAVIFFTLGILMVNASQVGGRNRTSNPKWFRACSLAVKGFGYLALASMGFYAIRVAGKRASK
eukprot:CAMPEP_0176453228 /NCGR_PEP_ID=MMETSP0127-20121128/29095_1 /TAXON_ID=938130 /ORGANISM="Platyophrya macrostoma, Strain WH" /LENGTH=278 /DNA_ID=CAMNT_0017842011 /DNA_START=49 /DNA_END=882 /DNA_ORIENTATION=+